LSDVDGGHLVLEKTGKNLGGKRYKSSKKPGRKARDQMKALKKAREVERVANFGSKSWGGGKPWEKPTGQG